MRNCIWSSRYLLPLGERNYIKSAREVEDSISTINGRLHPTYLCNLKCLCKTQRPLLQVTLPTTTSPTYHSHHTYFVHRCTTTTTSGAGVAESAYRSVVNTLWSREARSPPGSDSTRSFSQDIQKFSA